jgi:hypothetical protein
MSIDVKELREYPNSILSILFTCTIEESILIGERKVLQPKNHKQKLRKQNVIIFVIGIHIRRKRKLKLKRKSDKVLGFDFDGVFNRVLPPMHWVAIYSRPNDLIRRAHLDKLRTFMFRLYGYLPFLLDGTSIDKIPRDAIIISGRSLNREIAEEELRKLGFKYFYFRNNWRITEFQWKLRICKSLKITDFYDDRPTIVERLRKNGINAKLWRRN